MSALAKPQPGMAVTPAIILIGQQDNKPRGSWFAKTDLADARKAARLSGLKLVSVRSDKLRDLALRVPKGRIFSSGKAFTPLIQPSVYDALLPHAANAPAGSTSKRIKAQTGGEAGGAAGQTGGADVAAQDTILPKDWGSIGMGATVLAYSPEEEAWFEAIVTRADPNGKLTLRWRDYPDEPTILRQPHQLALLFPEGKKVSA